MTDKLSLIREKCIAAHPEIVELKFGCEIELRDEDFTRTVYIGGVGKCTKHKKAANCNEDCDIESALWLALVEDDPKELYEPAEWTIEKIRSDLYNILGRPIHLPDVLLAIGENVSGTLYATDNAGGFLKFESVGTEWAYTDFKWDLRADDLEKQSEETINFLYELLK